MSDCLVTVAPSTKSNSILSIKISETIKIEVFPGTYGERPDADIRIKYCDSNKSSRPRTPKHIHFCVDLLTKIDGKRRIMHSFIDKCLVLYDKIDRLPSRSYSDIKDLIEKYINKDNVFNLESKASEVDNHGEYPLVFDACLFLSFTVEEKNSSDNAHMFNDVLHKLSKKTIDRFSVLGTASHH